MTICNIFFFLKYYAVQLQYRDFLEKLLIII